MPMTDQSHNEYAFGTKVPPSMLRSPDWDEFALRKLVFGAITSGLEIMSASLFPGKLAPSDREYNEDANT